MSVYWGYYKSLAGSYFVFNEKIVLILCMSNTSLFVAVARLLFILSNWHNNVLKEHKFVRCTSV